MAGSASDEKGRGFDAERWMAAHRDRRPRLLLRAKLRAALARWFSQRGFMEADPAMLVRAPAGETHLAAFATCDGPAPDQRLTLHTSPEFACKKLIAAGEERLVVMGHAFRQGERSALHHPEFTLVEWYRTRAPLDDLVQDVEALLALAAETAGTLRLRWRGREANPFRRAQRLSVQEAFVRYLGVDPLVTLAEDGATDTERFRRALQAAGLHTAPDDTWSDLFAKALVTRIEPELGQDRATILHSYPLPEAALARPSDADPRIVERFELYACGVELANACAELTDAVALRARLEAAQAERFRRYGERHALDEELLAVLPAMPPTVGCALGFDRLAMLACGATTIEDVLWTQVP